MGTGPAGSGSSVRARRAGWNMIDRAGRVTFAGNWPICTATSDYGTMFETSLGALAALDEAGRHAVLGGTAASEYRIGESL